MAKTKPNEAPGAKAQEATQPQKRVGIIFKISAFVLLVATAAAVYYAEKHFVPTGHKVLFMAALFVCSVLLIMTGLPPFPQPLSYHLFADNRSLCCGVPNTFDVIVRPITDSQRPQIGYCRFDSYFSPWFSQSVQSALLLLWPVGSVGVGSESV
jgi:hypothetical protein